MYHEVWHIYDLCKCEEEERCETHKDCNQAARQIHIKYILTLDVWDDKLRTKSKMLKDNESIEDTYVEAGNSWHLKIAIKDIHAISLHKSKVANKAISGSFIKSFTYSRKGNK